MSAAAAASAPVPALRFRSCARSHAGADRAENQDRLLDRADARLWAVADGMGGHADGGRAAEAVVAALAAVEPGGSGYARMAAIERAIAEVNAALFTAGGARSGSTLVALLAHDAHLACLWAGDSRAYLLRAGRLDPLTRDHSLVQELVDGGLIDEAARRAHPRANVITRAVGGASELVLDRRFLPACAGDRLLLCSDGLLQRLSEAELTALLADPSPDRAADRVLATVLDRDTPDDVSLILIDVA